MAPPSCRRRVARRSSVAALAAAGCACVTAIHLGGLWASSSAGAFALGGRKSLHAARSDRVVTARHAAVDYGDPTALAEMMKDPEKMKKIQEDIDKVMADPQQKKALEMWQQQIQGGVEKLKQDPEMKAFFEDVEKNGMEAMKKYEKDERILRKFSEATGGPEAFGLQPPGAGGMAGGAVPGAPRSFKPGDEVIVDGLKAKPELNGKKAMVVPPTAEERETLKGTGRLIVRLMDTGDQFAVKPDNLRTTEQAANDLMGSSLEDVSMYNPALQTEAAKLRESGKLDDLQNDPELQPIFEDIKKNGMGALEKYWNDEKLMAKISKAMGTR